MSTEASLSDGDGQEDVMSVVVYELGGDKPFTIGIPPLATINDIRRLIHEKTGLWPGLQQVLLGDLALLDGLMLATECGIEDGSILTLVLQMPDKDVFRTLVEDRITMIHQLVTREVITEVPHFVIEYVDKHVAPGPVEVVEKVVEVPYTVYQDVFVEVPEIEEVVLRRQKAKPVVKYVDRPMVGQEIVTTREFNEVPLVFEDVQYVEKFVEVPITLTAERVVYDYSKCAGCCSFMCSEEKEARVVELVREVPRIHVEENRRIVKVKVFEYLEVTTECAIPVYRQSGSGPYSGTCRVNGGHLV